MLLLLVQGEKRPALSRWEIYNINPPSDLQLARWAETHPLCGIGLAYGPDQVLGVDLDYVDPEKAAAARAINDSYLSGSPMVRVGRSPKVLVFYRAAPGLQVPGKNFGGFELFRYSGQTVLYGIHPDTSRPYQWPEESPENLSPEDLPVVTQAMLDAFLAAMDPLREDRVRHNGTIITNAGKTATWLRQFSQMRTPAEMIEAACAGIRDVGVGARHHTMLAATMALVMRGVEPVQFVNAIEAAYTATLNRDEALVRRNAVHDAARWANAKACGGAVGIEPVTLKITW